MSVVALQRITLCGLQRDKATILDDLQRLGCLHLISLRPPPAEPEKVAPPRPEHAYRALRYLTDCPQQRRQLHNADGFDVEHVVAEVLENQQRLRDTIDRCDFLRQRIDEVTPWGDFRFPSLEALAGQRLWFYTIPHYQMRQISAPPSCPWQVVHRDNRHAWVVTIAAEEPPAEAFPVPRTHIGYLSLSTLHRDLELAEIEREELESERHALTRWIWLLSNNLARTEDRAALLFAAEQTRDDIDFFAVQGWLPVNRVGNVRSFAEEHDLALLLEEPEADAAAPTLLDNPQPVAAGEDLVRFFQTPGYRDWDPSPVLFLSFALFFAMILSDAGYAAVLGILLLSFWRRMGQSDSGRRLRTLAATVVGVSAAWGIAAGSYFGVTPVETSLAAALNFIDLNDFDAMIRLSVVIGALHLILANALKAWQYRGHPTAPTSLGWIAMICGGLSLWLANDGIGPAALASVAWLLLVGGALCVLYYAGAMRPQRRAIDRLWRLLDGLQALTNVTRAFGDVLSYMRLFALGLASASLAITFNQLAGDVAAAVPGIGIFLAILILLFGHILNFMLAVLSGVVHGLRLNFIEFYNWGMSEEGYPFRAFAKKEIGHE